jgi:hypothetical protein
MSNFIQPDNRVNNSISADKTLGVLEILEKIKENGNGTVSYVFNTERLIDIHAKPGNKDFGATRNHTYMINAPINKEVFLSEKSTTVYNKKLTEVLNVFKDTCWDMGASYFVLS